MTLILSPERLALLLELIRPVAGNDPDPERRRIARGLEMSLDLIKRQNEKKQFEDRSGESMAETKRRMTYGKD